MPEAAAETADHAPKVATKLDLPFLQMYSRCWNRDVLSASGKEAIAVLQRFGVNLRCCDCRFAPDDALPPRLHKDAVLTRRPKRPNFDESQW